MIYLLDVNVLLALFDAAHEHHERSHEWFEIHKEWASCPITENGLIRIASSPSYPGNLGTAQEVCESLQTFCKSSNHRFWADDLSARDSTVFLLDKLKATRHLTDVYLLGLSAKNGGCLATFDRSIPSQIVVNGEDALEIIP